MEYSKNIQLAIRFAIKTHEIYQQQKRKGSGVSYITHPLTVAIILAKSGASDSVICSGLLHDTIEDSIDNKKVTYEMIAERFTEDVADIVLAVTEEDKSLPWQERKDIALKKIPIVSKDALLVKSADVIANGRDVITDYKKEGDEAFEKFKAPLPKKDNAVNGQIRLITAIIDNWPNNPLAEDLRDLLLEFKKIVT